ncbi:ABC transporter ATP-binding protein [Coraliomargarita sp. SDUM461004]|uniref:ABC transporter ATP-binding protein n=1 Tax=Thalassobacterium sedimentorum TaxID=3041258 RepID=A0ABU1ALV9_9BACT|nr:ABC transporter ATP-binding protein [Coraliomargarita sp. SDUM461004]MDQ8195719.1 ABC transporter ATP-binding protein [Coraliomargarita sp. SDUM461004]
MTTAKLDFLASTRVFCRFRYQRICLEPMFFHRFGPYFKYLKPVRVQFGLGLLFGIIAAAASGAGLPFVIKYLVPLVTSDKAPEGMQLILILSSVPIAFTFRALGSFLNAYYMAYAGMHVLERLRLMVFTKIQELPLSFFHRNNVGDLMSRVTGDTSQLQSALVKVVNSLVKEPATLFSAIAFLIYLTITEREVAFMLIALASVPACVFPIKAIGTRILKKAKLAQRQAGEVNNVLNENLGSVREVRAYNLEAREIHRFSEACHKFFKLALKTVKYDKALSPMIEVVSAFAIVFALYVAVKKNISPEIMASILTALYMCYEPIKKLGGVSNTIRKAEASLDRLEHVLQTEDTVPETATPVPTRPLKGHIKFDHVTFSYKEEVALKDIEIDIAPGEVIALVGPSGAGKSTFANMVPRFYDTLQGCVSIDGTNVKDFRKGDLRSQIALVSQEAILFNESIAHNIGIGKEGASDQEIRKAAEMANAADFIQQLEGQYEYQVGERGNRLSGGQRQRISIARAFLKDAPIIILDEPTSALDAESEHAIQAALEKLSAGRTVLIIAHRFSTIQHADRILVFDAGSIVANGTHQALYRNSPLYKSLYDKQSNTAQAHMHLPNQEKQ